MQAPEFLGPLALIFLAALGAAYVLHRLRQPSLIVLPWVESETEEIRRTREDGFRRFRAPGAPQA